jgi:PPK2 family polyphosphate:nucleotide phosphotransferase
MSMDTARYRVTQGSPVDLAAWDPDDDGGYAKAAARGRTSRLRTELGKLQEMLWVDRRHRLLVVLQAMDTGGKDGTIRSVFAGVNPQGVSVASFRAPTHDELAHDYLWRIHRHTPRAGEIAIFNRSHYEDVLVARVNGLVPERRWSRRYGHINAFEEMLDDEGTTIRKFFLHISKDEQRARQQQRIDDPTKRWKFSHADLEARARWDDYMVAFTDMLTETSTAHAPWHVIPANRKWFRDLVVIQILVDTLRAMKLDYPEPQSDIAGLVVE